MTVSAPDKFLDGRISLMQSDDGYRAGMDAVLLAASLSAEPGQHLVEFGCGPGAALLCAASRLDACRFTGIEIDPAAAALAVGNAARNGLQDRVEIRKADIAAPGDDLDAHQVFFNPPFFDDASALRTPKAGKQRAWLSGDTPLASWVSAAAKILRAKGRLTLIHRADKLADIIAALAPSFGSVVIKPVLPHAGRDAKRVLVTARLGGKAPLRLLPPLVLHDDGPAPHTPEADEILRGRAVIDLG